MFISEEPEAWVNGVDTDPEEIDDKAQDFSERFGEMMRSGRPLEEIAAELMDPRHRDSELPGLLNDTEAVLGALFTEPARSTMRLRRIDRATREGDFLENDYL